MESVVRGVIVYVFLLIVFRLAGKRTLAQASNFELVLLLIISETTQQAMVDNDHSLTNSFLLILTLMGCTVTLSVIKERFPKLERWIDDAPLIVVENGRLHKDRMLKERVDEEDILSAAREHQGLEKMDDIKYAILERDGHITIIPKRSAKA